jgi:3-oxoacyl-[acyl-carrier-protein] synthase III
VRIESIGILDQPAAQPADTVAMLRQAGEACLRQSARPRNEIELVLHTGVYRSEFLSEPAVAAIAAGELGINHDEKQSTGRRTLAFDVLNGAGGSLTACFLACGLMAGRYARALLLASEVDPHRRYWPENPLGLTETASALVLEPSGNTEGLAAFAYRSFPQHADAIVSFTGAHDNKPAVFRRLDPALESTLAECVCLTVQEFLAREALSPQALAVVVPPARPVNLGPRLAQTLGVEPDRLVLPEGDGDYFTSSLAYAFQKLRREGRLTPGAAVLLVEVAAGLQVWCGLYYP